MPPSSLPSPGTLRWMGPELIAPEEFGLDSCRPTKSSDCYSLGMVIYETISGNLPLHDLPDPAIFWKVVQGKRPDREAGFTDSLWEMMEWCWKPQPNERPSIEEVLEFLEMCSNSPSPPSAGVDRAEEMPGMPLFSYCSLIRSFGFTLPIDPLPLKRYHPQPSSSELPLGPPQSYQPFSPFSRRRVITSRSSSPSETDSSASSITS